MIATPSPFLPLPSPEEMESLVAAGKGDELAAWLARREERIAQADESLGDPYRHGFELPHWSDADRLVAECLLVYSAGGKRASKSEWAAKRVVRAACTYPRGKIWCFQDNERSSITMQQSLIYKYLPKAYKEMMPLRDRIAKMVYSQAGGFTDRLLILPNETEIHFLTYNQEPEDYQGWELGSPRHLVDKIRRDDPATEAVPNVGAWPDEDMPMTWLETLKQRCSTRGSKILWTYSPLLGITTTIKDVTGGMRTIESRPAELLSERQNVPGLPKGHMPYIQRGTMGESKTAAIYFFTQWNPASGYNEEGGIKALCVGQPTDYIERNAYGYARDTVNRACPLFSTDINVIRPEDAPSTGTNYLLVDPAGKRNWYMFWIRITGEDPPRYVIYREWPDAVTFGEWAVPSQNPRQPDGDPGPAQRCLGYSIARYKQLILEQERIRPPIREGKLHEPDPLRRALAVKALEAAGFHEPYPAEAARALLDVVEPIFERGIDPRAGKEERTAVTGGGTCLIEKLADENHDPRTGEIVAPRMYFTPMAGLGVEEGFTAINHLLYYNREEEVIPFYNAPQLYVVNTCAHMIWSLSNFTGMGGDKAGGKDPMDLARYLATSEWRHIEGGRLQVYGGGSY